jgi:hypothetical protein
MFRPNWSSSGHLQDTKVPNILAGIPGVQSAVVTRLNQMKPANILTPYFVSSILILSDKFCLPAGT